VAEARAGGGASVRLDKFLWFTRLTKTRGAAQETAEAGHLRIDGRVVDRAHCPVRPGNVLSFPLHGRVRIIRVEALPRRRGPAAEARACYTDLAPAPSIGPDENDLTDIDDVDAPDART
jgi:ribosome-associated heat shock protein Hsp15